MEVLEKKCISESDRKMNLFAEHRHFLAVFVFKTFQKKGSENGGIFNRTVKVRSVRDSFTTIFWLLLLFQFSWFTFQIDFVRKHVRQNTNKYLWQISDVANFHSPTIDQLHKFQSKIREHVMAVSHLNLNWIFGWFVFNCESNSKNECQFERNE